jgi:hypothetical protein
MGQGDPSEIIRIRHVYHFAGAEPGIRAEDGVPVAVLSLAKDDGHIDHVGIPTSEVPAAVKDLLRAAEKQGVVWATDALRAIEAIELHVTLVDQEEEHEDGFEPYADWCGEGENEDADGEAA